METEDADSSTNKVQEVLNSSSGETFEFEKPMNSTTQIIKIQESSEDEIQWSKSEQQSISVTVDQSESIETSDEIIWGGSVALDIETVSEQNNIVVEDLNESLQTDEGGEQDDEAPQNRVETKKPIRKKYKKVLNVVERNFELENNVQDVRARFQLGCECNDDSCFRGLNPETVYRHRLNIAELTKEEHDMYLMGVTMACMADPGVTVKRKERQRLRAQYVYQGRRVCLSAFLYLENCTLYQLKRIRKHVMTHGVTPRVHGNHGKKPHNVFSLDIYRRATKFLKNYIELHTPSTGGNLKSPVLLSSDISRKTIHNEYQEFVKSVAPPGEKIMGYSTFRHFLKEQFPHVRFGRPEIGTGSNSSHSNNNTVKHISATCRNMKSDMEQINSNHGEIVSATQVTAIPLILSSDACKTESVTTPTYIVTPVQQIVHTQPDFTSYQPHTITVAPLSNAAYAFTM